MTNHSCRRNLMLVLVKMERTPSTFWTIQNWTIWPISLYIYINHPWCLRSSLAIQNLYNTKDKNPMRTVKNKPKSSQTYYKIKALEASLELIPQSQSPKVFKISESDCLRKMKNNEWSHSHSEQKIPQKLFIWWIVYQYFFICSYKNA